MQKFFPFARKIICMHCFCKGNFDIFKFAAKTLVMSLDGYR